MVTNLESTAALSAFPNGVAAGDVTANDATLWARPLSAGTVHFDIATDANFLNVVAGRDVAAASGNPVHADISNLTAGTRYYYRAVLPSGESETGTFVTAAQDGYNGLRFGVSGDWRSGLTPYSALANADDAALDFFVQLGDTIYADRASPAVPKPLAETLAEYEAKYAETLTERGGANFLADLRASTAVYAMIDDHEVIDDFAGGAPATSDPERFDPTGANFINETSRYRTGLQAFHEYQPIEQRVWSGTGDPVFDGKPDLYRTQTYGTDAALFLVDARSFRDQELEDADLSSEADVVRFLTEAANPDRTMLGSPQFERLKADLLAAQEQGTLWKFVMVPEPIQNLGPAEAADRFEGYAAERNALLKFVDDNNISNVVFIAADIHGTVVNNLTYQASPGGAQIALDAFEISTGAVAYSPTLGPSIVGLAEEAGLLSGAQKFVYDHFLEIDPDKDSFPEDKDDFVKSLINEQLDPFGYDPLGLNDNLDLTDGLVDAALIRGDYVAVHHFGWTQFEIDEATHALTVTTYGVRSYDEDDAAENPAAIAGRDSDIISQFIVHPDQALEGSRAAEDLVGGLGDDVLDGGAAADNLTGNAGNDIFDYNAVSDSRGSARDRILDFTPGQDRIDFSTMDANSKVEGNQAFIFVCTEQFTAVPGQLRFERSGDQTIVKGDTNGDRRADFSVAIMGAFELHDSDFLL
jgi:alkaline phosphatase D